MVCEIVWDFFATLPSPDFSHLPGYLPSPDSGTLIQPCSLLSLQFLGTGSGDSKNRVEISWGVQIGEQNLLGLVELLGAKEMD